MKNYPKGITVIIASKKSGQAYVFGKMPSRESYSMYRTKKDTSGETQLALVATFQSFDEFERFLSFVRHAAGESIGSIIVCEDHPPKA